MSANGGGSSCSANPADGRFHPGGRAKLRRASFISPITGERSKRTFTLREASNRLNGSASESTPLLGHADHDEPGSRTASAFVYCTKQWRTFLEFANSKNGRGVFKCSLAYLLGSLVTFVPALAALIGSGQDSKHVSRLIMESMSWLISALSNPGEQY